MNPPPIKVSGFRGTSSPAIGFLPRTAVSRSQPGTLFCASSASGTRIASLMNFTISLTSPLAKFLSRSMGSVKICLARSHNSSYLKTLTRSVQSSG